MSVLPEDLWREALRFLGHNDVLTMSLTCKQFRRVLLLPPFHRVWQTMVIDSTRARWTHVLTRATAAHGSVCLPRVLIGTAGARLHSLQLGHRMYPAATPNFGNMQLVLIANACPLLHTLKLFYRDVSFTLSSLTHLFQSCLLLKTVAMPFGGVKLRTQLCKQWLKEGSVAALSPCWLNTLRLHNVSGCIVRDFASTSLVPYLFRNTLASLRLVNVTHMENLNFVADMPLLRHLTVKHCRRLSFAPIVHTPHAWMYNVAPQLHSFCLVDADHVVCEQMILRSIFGTIEPALFTALRELRVDGEMMFTAAATFFDLDSVLMCSTQCAEEQHPFRTWTKHTRCGSCRASGPAYLHELETIYFYNETSYALHDTLV